MTAERRYGFRFNGMEGGLLLGGVLLASFLIFVSGVYVGREVAGRKGVAQGQVVRVPVSAFTDQVAAKSTLMNDPGKATRTAAVNTPLAWPVAREKMTSPAPAVAKPEESQQKEKIEPKLAQMDTSAVPMNTPRSAPSPTVKEETTPRTRPMVEPFAPKSPIAVASRGEKTSASQSVRENARVEVSKPSPQTSRSGAEERKSIAQNSRNDATEKKPLAVTVANVEKIESPVRPRMATADGKRPGDEKRNNTATRPRVLAAEERRASEDKNTEAKSAVAAAKKSQKQLAGWRVQVGATTYQETAQDMARELRELGYDPMVSKVQMNGETLYRVRIGKFGKQGEAVAAVGRFRREGRFSQAYLVSE